MLLGTCYPALAGYVRELYSMIEPEVEWKAFRQYYRWAVGLASDEPLPDVEKIKASAGRPHQRESVSGEHKHVELQPEEAAA